jgi:hypothetical protein
MVRSTLRGGCGKQVRLNECDENSVRIHHMGEEGEKGGPSRRVGKEAGRDTGASTGCPGRPLVI